jgi:3-mercaptopropionate dioxygenase
MTSTAPYTVEQFVGDARRVLSDAGGDRDRAVANLLPLVEAVLWDDGLLDESRRGEPVDGRARYEHYRAEDGSLLVYVVEFVPGMPTPVHDHVTWGIIGICGGVQQTELYERLDDGSDSERADLRKFRDQPLSRGAAYALLAPRDIHRIETVGDEPSYSLHVIAGDLTRQHRHIFDLETGAVTEVTGRRM